MVRPSGETVHFSASHGSGSPETRLMRTSVAWVRRATASTAACAALGANRVKVLGSLRSDATSVPPRTGPVPADFSGVGAVPEHAASTAAARIPANWRMYRPSLDLTGQLLGRVSEARIYWVS